MKYYLSDSDKFVIEGYNSAKPFSSFLPGIAGERGIPLWAFYVNRGQCIASFGTQNKDRPIMEFYPANKAYQLTSLVGFRTFIKINRGKGAVFYEPFKNDSSNMMISSYDLTIEERNQALGIASRVHYFTIPNEPVAALAREVSISNISDKPIEIELLDGIPQIIPFGMNEWFLKHMSRTIEAWMEVENLERGAPFYKLRVDAADKSEVVFIKAGNFFITDASRVIVDPAMIFGDGMDFVSPRNFIMRQGWRPPIKQVCQGKTPCAFGYAKFTLKPKAGRRLNEIFGLAEGLDTLNKYARRALRSDYLSAKSQENKEIIQEIEGSVLTSSRRQEFDLYVRQTFLDNCLRGGYPRKNYLYLRRHGDLERDYNNFQLPATPHSSGDGNYRDICQNRRNDVWFEPKIMDANIIKFLSLIQPDGYNPLIVKGTGNGAEHTEGFWIDHWIYNLDLLESYLAVYPEKLREVLLEKREFTFFYNKAYVLPRHLRYHLKDGKIRQHNSLALDERANFRELNYKTTLIVKLFCILANKLATLDPFGIGIEMEADKPGWNDSLNGLPGLLGSSVVETFGLARLCLFLEEAFENLEIDLSHTLFLPEELSEFIIALLPLLREKDDFTYWDEANLLKEAYRERVRFGFSGRERALKVGDLKIFLSDAREKLRRGISKAQDKKTGLYWTYFVNEVMEFDQKRNMPTKFRSRPLPFFLEGNVYGMRHKQNPDEARPVRNRISNGARALYRAVKKSPLYDKALGMYKINAPLKKESEEIGRLVIFTPGWLENETIWLHMEYKYLLELLRKGLYEEFFKDAKRALIPFQPPARYGRSILENSSFLVSSAYPDKSLHGMGFVARLTGATAEFINMWLLMSAGQKPFFLGEDGSLNLKLSPILPGWLFKRDGTYAFKFLGTTDVVYHNPKRQDTFGPSGLKVQRISVDGNEFAGGLIPSPYAAKVRDGQVKRIDVFLE